LEVNAFGGSVVGVDVALGRLKGDGEAAEFERNGRRRMGRRCEAALINMVARLSQAVRHRCAAALVVVVRSGCYVDMAGVDMLYASYMRVYRMMSWKLKRA
jgi:hypothetical protein